MRVAFLAVMIVLCPVLHASQIDRFISSAEQQLGVVQAQGLREDYLQNQPSAAWLEEVELRTDFDDEVALDQGEYALRIRPKSWSQVDAENHVYQLQAQINGVEYLAALGEALKQRYQVLIKLLYTHQLIQLSSRRITLSKAKVEAYRERAGSEEFKFSNLMDAEGQLGKHTLRHLAYRHQYEAMLGEYEIGSSLSASISHGDWLSSPDEIMQQVEREMEQDRSEQDNTALMQKHYATQLAEQEYVLEKDKSGASLSFFQLGYEFDRRNDGAFSLAAGMTIPLPWVEQRSVVKRRLYLLSAQHEQLHWQQRTRLQIRQYRQILSHTYETLQVAKAQQRKGIDDVQASAANTISPLMLIELKEHYATLEEQLINLRQELYLTYIDLMHLCGATTRVPLRNLLAKTMSPLS